jgi:hypothetical protein
MPKISGAWCKISVNVNADKLIMAFNRAPMEVAKTIRVEMKKQLQEVQNEARLNHRFITRTGMLERSIDKTVDESGLIGIVYLNLALAPYARRIHQGWGTWNADQFLYIAFSKKIEQIKEALDRAVDRAFKKVGL